jgi:DNA-binding transcriptional MerR regulator
MDEERTESARGDLAGVHPDPSGDSGWIKTRVAAEALGVDPRTVRAYIERGDLVARSEGEGIQKAYLVSIDSVYALRDSRGSSARKSRISGAGARERPARNADLAGARGGALGDARGVAAEDLADIIRDLAAEAARMAAEAAEFRTRLELTANAESTLREQLERERERADRLEAELASLREARQPSPAPPGASETVSETPEGTDDDTPTDRADRETGVQRRSSWWRRFFGFE